MHTHRSEAWLLRHETRALKNSAVGVAVAASLMVATPLHALTVSAGPGQVVRLTGSQVISGLSISGGSVLFNDAPGQSGVALTLGNTGLSSGLLAYERQFSPPGQSRVELGGLTTILSAGAGAPINFNGASAMLLGDPARASSGFNVESYVGGRVNQARNSNVVLANGVSIINQWGNRYILDEGAILQTWSAASVGAGFRNLAQGVLEMGALSGVAKVAVPIVNDGHIYTRGGELQLLAGGIHRDGSNIKLFDSGQVTLSGTHTIEGQVGVEGKVGAIGGGSLNVVGGAELRLSPGATLGSSAHIAIDNGAVLQLNPGALLANAGSLWVSGSLSGTDAILDNYVGGSVLVTGQAQGFDVRSNYGDFDVAPGASAVLGSYMQYAGELRVDGTLEARRHIASDGTYQPGMRLLGGRLSGTGTINGDVFVGADAAHAEFNPGNSPGHMTIDGRLTLVNGSQMNLEVERDANGQLHFDSVSAQDFMLDGSIVFHIADSLTGDELANVELLSLLPGCDATVSTCGFTFGTFFSVGFDARPGWSAEFDSTGIRLRGPDAGPTTPIPLPGTLSTALAGLFAYGLSRRQGRNRTPTQAGSPGVLWSCIQKRNQSV